MWNTLRDKMLYFILISSTWCSLFIRAQTSDWINIITPPLQTQNTVYEIVSDMSSRQDALEERLSGLEDKLVAIQEQMELLPDVLTRCLTQHAERMDQRRNFLHPESAASLQPVPSTPVPTLHHPLLSSTPGASTSPLLIPHSRSVPNPWPPSPILPPISSRTPHLVPEPMRPSSNTTATTTTVTTTTTTSSSWKTDTIGPYDCPVMVWMWHYCKQLASISEIDR